MAESTDFSTTLVLVRSARAGDEASLDRLFERYLPRVRELAARKLGRELAGFVEIDDVVQQSMIDAFQGIGGFSDDSESEFVRWIARIVQNNVRDLSRRLQVRKGVVPLADREGSSAVGAPPAVSREPSPTQMARTSELEEIQQRALRALHPRYRAVILLREMRGLSTEQVARELGYARPETVRVKLSVAKKQLRDLMERFGVS